MRRASLWTELSKKAKMTDVKADYIANSADPKNIQDLTTFVSRYFVRTVCQGFTGQISKGNSDGISRNWSINFGKKFHFAVKSAIDRRSKSADKPKLDDIFPVN